MKLILSLRVVLIALILTCVNSCKTPIKTTTSWVNKEKIRHEPYKSVFIMVLTDNLDAKTYMENDLAAAATARGLKAYTFIDVFGPIASIEYLPKQEIILKKVAGLPCETIFTVALVDVMSSTRYVPESTTIYSPYGVGPYGYYGTFGGYYTNSVALYTPGYYQTDKKYFLESNLYDVATDDLLMSIQSKAVNPPEIKKSSKEYTRTLVEEITRLRKANP